MAADPFSPHPTDPNRRADGKFAPGHRASVGNHGGRPRTEYVSIMADELTPIAWRKIVVKAIDQAQEGDDKARTWLSNYAIGKPVEQVVAAITDEREKFDALVMGLRGLLPDAQDDEDGE